MKFTCLQENLAEGIRVVGYIATRATNLAVLTNVMVRVQGGTIQLVSTNLEAGIRCQVRGKVEEEGEALIPARLLLDLLPLLSHGVMHLGSAAGGLQVKTETTTTTIRTAPTAEYPIIPTLESDIVEMELPTDLFIQSLKSVAVAAGKVEQRPQFNGVLLQTTPHGLVCAATDGYRLAEATLPQKKKDDVRVILPLSVVQEIIRIHGGVTEYEHLTLRVTEAQAEIVSPLVSIVSRLVDGEYPEYHSLFPEGSQNTATIPAHELVKALKASTLFSRAGMSDVVLRFYPKQSQVVVSAENADIGAYQTQISCVATGDDVQVTLNARYILDGISAISSPDIEMTITASDRPVLLFPHKSEAQFRYLIMPIRQ